MSETDMFIMKILVDTETLSFIFKITRGGGSVLAKQYEAKYRCIVKHCYELFERPEFDSIYIFFGDKRKIGTQ